MRLCPLFGLLAVIALPWSQCLADQTTAQADFRQGVEAFQNGELELAKRKLEMARSQGLGSSALLYNLGVVYFRLGHYDEAQAAFSKLLGTSHTPLARYNLGLVFKEKNEPETARLWFSRAADPASPSQIQALAKRQLALKPSSTGDQADPVSAVGFVSFAAGYDDNIAGTPSGVTTNESGAYADLLASGRAYFFRDAGQALRLDATAYTRQYPDNGDFDSTYVSTGVAWQQPLDAARLTTGLSLVGSWFDADLLERQVRLDVSYQRPGCFWSPAAMVDCQFEGYAATVTGGSGFRAYDGNDYGGSASVNRVIGAWGLRASYDLDVDRRRDLETQSEFFSLSPMRHSITLRAERRFSETLSLGAKQVVRLSRYSEPHRLIQDGQVQTQTREDEQFKSSLFAGYKLDERWQLRAELSWTDNQSNLDRYDYHRAEMFVSLDAVF